ncbi:MAG TPA: hypothetical protein PKY81_02490 [bacterium]|nr:hypothetical protein [bacterium]HPN29804.1 hypothetical protein [bacterium]
MNLFKIDSQNIDDDYIEDKILFRLIEETFTDGLLDISASKKYYFELEKGL